MPRLSSFGYRFILAMLLLILKGGSRICYADPIGKQKLPLVSAGVVRLPDARLGFTRGFLARDPDGHVLSFSMP